MRIYQHKKNKELQISATQNKGKDFENLLYYIGTTWKIPYRLLAKPKLFSKTINFTFSKKNFIVKENEYFCVHNLYNDSLTIKNFFIINQENFEENFEEISIKDFNCLNIRLKNSITSLEIIDIIYNKNYCKELVVIKNKKGFMLHLVKDLEQDKLSKFIKTFNLSISVFSNGHIFTLRTILGNFWKDLSINDKLILGKVFKKIIKNRQDVKILKKTKQNNYLKV
jgi:hypothetical protein